MYNKFSKEQLEKLLLHTVGINSILTEVLLSPQDESPFEEDVTEDVDLEIFATGINFADLCESENRPQPQPAITNCNDLDRIQREQTLTRMCGKWTTGNNQCGIDISRAGEHFVLTYLKRNGQPSDQRYILIWLDGDILYYGREDRITVVALNTESDTLMISPGSDYTRISKCEKK